MGNLENLNVKEVVKCSGEEVLTDESHKETTLHIDVSQQEQVLATPDQTTVTEVIDVGPLVQPKTVEVDMKSTTSTTIMQQTSSFTEVSPSLISLSYSRKILN